MNRELQFSCECGWCGNVEDLDTRGCCPDCGKELLIEEPL